jgi:hypothetical protein
MSLDEHTVLCWVTVAFAVFVLVIQKQCVWSHVSILKMEDATTAVPAPITPSVPSEPIARWGFRLRMSFQNNNSGVLCLNGVPYQTPYILPLTAGLWRTLRQRTKYR